MLVERDVDAFAAATHGYAGIAFAAFHGVGGKVGIVGIIATLGGVAAEIVQGGTFLFEECYFVSFEFRFAFTRNQK